MSFLLIFRPDTSKKRVVLWQLPSGKVRVVPFLLLLLLAFVALAATIWVGDMAWRYLISISIYIALLYWIDNRTPFVSK